jgi:enoyl-CoA hydratase/carnithine racemase
MRSEVTHFQCRIENGIAHLALDRPERKNPLTFDSYAELRDWFRDLHYDDAVHAVVFGPNGGNFSSGGDVHEPALFIQFISGRLRAPESAVESGC